MTIMVYWNDLALDLVFIWNVAMEWGFFCQWIYQIIIQWFVEIPSFLDNYNVQLSSSQHTWHISLWGFRSLNEILIFGQCVYFKCRWCIWKGYAFEQELLFQFFVRVQPIVIWAMCLFYHSISAEDFFSSPFHYSLMTCRCSCLSYNHYALQVAV